MIRDFFAMSGLFSATKARHCSAKYQNNNFPRLWGNLEYGGGKFLVNICIPKNWNIKWSTSVHSVKEANSDAIRNSRDTQKQKEMNSTRTNERDRVTTYLPNSRTHTAIIPNWNETKWIGKLMQNGILAKPIYQWAKDSRRLKKPEREELANFSQETKCGIYRWTRLTLFDRGTASRRGPDQAVAEHPSQRRHGPKKQKLKGKKNIPRWGKSRTEPNLD